MAMWKSATHLVQGNIESQRVVLGTVFCVSNNQIYSDFTQHHGMHGSFEVVCPGCSAAETFGPAEIVREEQN